MPFGRAGVLGQASLLAGWLGSGPKVLRGGGVFRHDGTGTQAERRPSCRGMEPAKFGHDAAGLFLVFFLFDMFIVF